VNTACISGLSDEERDQLVESLADQVDILTKPRTLRKHETATRSEQPKRRPKVKHVRMAELLATIE